jgi:glycosyltransferase involved in cell wall biosynthesis
VILSLFIEQPEFLHPEAEGLAVHGANLATAGLLQRCARDPGIDALEVFLPPQVMARPAALAEAARALMPAGRAGQGFLRFHPVHALPETWADGRPRILFCIDPEDLPRVRYLRDRFARGPTAISCDTHVGESQRLLAPLARVLAAGPVAHDAVVCLSTRQQESLRRLLASLGDGGGLRLERIPRAVDCERFRPVDEEERRRARLQLGLPTSGTITLFFGRLTAYTKADLLPLIEAFAEVAGPEDHLLIVGREHPPGYAALLREAGAGLGARLIVRGEAAPALRPLHYAASDIFALPGDNLPETFGNAVLEAMASGLPVIASDWVGYSDQVEHGVSGELVPTWFMPGLERVSALSPLAQRNADHLYTGQSLWVDAPALAAALRRALTAPAARVAQGAAGRRRAEAHAEAAIHARWRALWTAQLAAAAAEEPAAMERRRADADALGQPSRYLDWYGHYATGVIGPQHRFRLNERGRAVTVRARPLRFYDDLLPLVHRDLIDALFAVLKDQRDWMTRAALEGAVAARCAHGADDIRFHLGLLLKRGLLDAAPSAP